MVSEVLVLENQEGSLMDKYKVICYAKQEQHKSKFFAFQNNSVLEFLIVALANAMTFTFTPLTTSPPHFKAPNEMKWDEQLHFRLYPAAFFT